MKIESTQNQSYKTVMKLKQRKYRMKTKQFIVEGYHLVEEAMKSGVIVQLIIREDANLTHEYEQYPSLLLADDLFNSLATTPSPQPVMAVCTMSEKSITKQTRLLLCDAVQDPGNMGTLIRSAVAFGFDGVILGEGCCDVYNEKVLRSTQGAIFKLPIVQSNLEHEVEKLQISGVSVYGTSVTRALALADVVACEQMAFILGNEGSGVQQALLEATNQNIYIEMNENVESLNVSIAGSIIMHQFRQ